ncbi:MAG TPA: hypothetical protein VIG68_08785, partial [Lysobacter sp.]
MTPAARMPPITPATAAALVAGALVALLAPTLPHPLVAVAFLVAGLPVACRWPRARLAGVAAVGLALAWLHAAYALSIRLPPALEHREVTVVGRVVDLPTHEPAR